MRALITGGAGYKGVKLADALLDAGHQVTILDNFMYGFDSVFDVSRRPHLDIVQKDVRGLEPGDVSAFDMVFHLAAISGYLGCEANPKSARAINQTASEDLAGLLSKDQFLVYASTTSIYGKSEEMLNEDSPVAAVSLYAETKLKAEQATMQRDNSISLRFATVFGVAPRVRHDLMPHDFVIKAIHERSLLLFAGHSKRAFMHIDDAIAAYMLIASDPDAAAGKVLNVGTPRLSLSKMDLAEAIGKQVKFKIVDSGLPDPDQRDFVIDYSRVEALGFKAQRSLEEGITELVKLYSVFNPYVVYRVI
jgi:nucleoside-diphosphate-sugar epimerase